jgi:3',5'-cyclic AMP phosphodiesterase CpdA
MASVARATLLLLLVVSGCGQAPRPGAPPEDAVLFTGAGDIATCEGTGDDETAMLLDRIPGLIWTAGDNAYPAGTAADFQACYDPTWGRHRARTRPVPGNHEYWTPGALPYFAYFGEAAGEVGKGWYSYRYGDWLIIALNSNIETERWSEQVRWLRKLLRENPSECTLAYFHHPLVSSGAHGENSDTHDDANVMAFWEALYNAGAEVVLVGHDHHYERFAPITPWGGASPRGIRQFVVGTGGGSLRGRGRHEPHPASEAFIQDRHGVLKLTLGRGGYQWEFVATGGRVLDRGEAACH